MISVLIKKEMHRFLEEAKLACDFLFGTLGYEYRYIIREEELRRNELLFIYGVLEPTQDEMYEMALQRIAFFIPLQPELLQPGKLNRDQIRGMIREIKYLRHTPVLAGRDLESPLYYYKNSDIFFGKYNFDLLGNIFFHLVNYEYYSIEARDKFERLSDNMSAFTEYSQFPFINTLLWLVEETIKDALTERSEYVLLKKDYWPGGQPYAAALSHNVESLRKWTFSSILKSTFTDLLIFYKIRYLIRNISRKIRYIATNIEEYWNFDIISESEQEQGVRSTFFFIMAEESGRITDYSAADRDILEEIQALMKADHEIALLASLESSRTEAIRKQKEALLDITEEVKMGVRQSRNRLEPDVTPQYHNKYDFYYDSSLGFCETNGFKNGFGYPLQQVITGKEERGKFRFTSGQCLELPLVFSDGNLVLSKARQVGFEQARSSLEFMISLLNKYNGFLGVNFSVHNFAELTYDNQLYMQFLSRLKSDNAYIGRCRDLARWWRKRKIVRLEEESSEIRINFPEAVQSMSFLLFGQFQVNKVEGAKAEIMGNRIYLREIAPGITVILRLSKQRRQPDEGENA